MFTILLAVFSATVLMLSVGCSSNEGGDIDKETGAATAVTVSHSEVVQKMTFLAACLNLGFSASEAGRAEACPRVIYVWSPVMSISELGIENIRQATKTLEVGLTLIDGEALRDWFENPDQENALSEKVRSSANRAEQAGRELAERMISAGATAHYPAVLVLDSTGVAGNAILGFKTSDTYREMLSRRLNRQASGDTRTVDAKESGQELQRQGPPRVPAKPIERKSSLSDGDAVVVREIEVDGRPGAYFRHVPRTSVLWFEVAKRNQFLDLTDGRLRPAPGTVDLVPSPDGRYLVTPRSRRAGLEFYETSAVLGQRDLTSAATTAPVFVDSDMRDQYPSVGMLEESKNASVYRVLTSWYDGIVHRDYEVRHREGSRRPIVTPLSPPVHTCGAYELSTPIISKNGLEVAGRDEATGTTKIFRIDLGTSCDEVLDTGLQTGKVAWDSTGSRVAFAIPRGVLPSGVRDLRKGRILHGVFVLDRGQMILTRVPRSSDADRLTFPDFVEDTTLVFIVRGGTGQHDRFLLVCCLDG